MGSGTTTFTLDDALLTALANYAIAKAKVDLPGPLPVTRVPIPAVTVSTHTGNKIAFKAGALPPVEVEPEIDPAGLVNLQVSLGVLGFPEVINDAFQRPINREIAELQEKLAEQGLELQLTNIETREGELIIAATMTVN